MSTMMIPSNIKPCGWRTRTHTCKNHCWKGGEYCTVHKRAIARKEITQRAWKIATCEITGTCACDRKQRKELASLYRDELLHLSGLFTSQDAIARAKSEAKRKAYAEFKSMCRCQKRERRRRALQYQME